MTTYTLGAGFLLEEMATYILRAGIPLGEMVTTNTVQYLLRAGFPLGEMVTRPTHTRTVPPSAVVAHGTWAAVMKRPGRRRKHT